MSRNVHASDQYFKEKTSSISSAYLLSRRWRLPCQMEIRPENVRTNKNGLYMVSKLRDHTLAVDINENGSAVSLYIWQKQIKKLLVQTYWRFRLIQMKACTPASVLHSTARTTKSGANTLSVSWSMTGNRMEERSTECTGIVTAQTMTHRNPSSTSYNTLWRNVNVENSTHRGRFVKPAAGSDTWCAKASTHPWNHSRCCSTCKDLPYPLK